jgi:hypothetical protein
MTSHSNAEQEESSDSESDYENTYEGRERTEEEWKNFWSTKYEHSSKKPMKEPLTASLDVHISDEDVEKLKVGLRARSMEDKWDFLIEDPDENDNISLHILRSWCGKQDDCYVLHIVVPKPSNDGGGNAKIEGITWEGNKAGLQYDAEQAKLEAVLLCRGHLKCEFEKLPDYPASMFWKNLKRLDDYDDYR